MRDSLPPPPELDLPVARAWAEAIEIFRLHRPARPLPLAEREAARLVGALVVLRDPGRRSAGANDRVPPVALLRRLSAPLRARMSMLSGDLPAAAPDG